MALSLRRRKPERKPGIHDKSWDQIAKAASAVVSVLPPAAGNGQLDVARIAQQAATKLDPQVEVTPQDIEAALVEQGMDWVQPFAPGRPLAPYYGYSKSPRTWNYTTGRNTTTEPRNERIPFTTLTQLMDGYDVAQICRQHIINDVRSMPISVSAMDGWTESADKEIEAAKQFLRKPDGKHLFRPWLARWLWDVVSYDAGTLYKIRNNAGKVTGLKVIDGRCYSDDTEVLTDAGWKRFIDVDISTDRFATRNPKTQAFEWQEATYYHRAPFAGEMCHFTSRTVDLLVSPNHRMLVTSLPHALGGHSHRSGDAIVRAEDLADHVGDRLSGKTAIPATSEWEAPDVQSFTVTAAPKDPTVGGPQAKDFVFESGDDFAAFMGMWLAEGCAPGKNHVVVTQDPKSKGYEPFRDLLTRVLGREPSRPGASWQFRSSALHAYLKQFGHAKDKFIPSELKEMSRRQLGIFWEYYRLGDGHTEASGRTTMTTASKRMADDLQEIAQKLGHSASIRQYASRPSRMADGRVIPGGLTYTIRLRTTDAQQFRAERVSYDGEVFCVSVPNEILYVRRNGQPAWCGNTISPDVDYFGDPPEPPAPAYQQWVEGLSWGWHTTDDLVYEPYTPMPGSVYGLAPIESVVLNANTDVRFQYYFLQFFTQGTVPEGFVEAPPDLSSPDQVEEWQEVWDSFMTGDQSKRQGLRWLPANAKYTATKATSWNEAFPEYLMRRTVAAFGLVPQDLGFTVDVNRATGDTQADVQFRISTVPRSNYIEDLLDDILQTDLELPVKVRFDTGRETEDRLATANAMQAYVNMGAISPDEVRERELGLTVDPEAMTPRAIYNNRLGALPLSYIQSISGDTDPETGAPVPGTVIPTQFMLPGQQAPDPTATPDAQAQAATALHDAANPDKGSALPEDLKPERQAAPASVPQQSAGDLRDQPGSIRDRTDSNDESGSPVGDETPEDFTKATRSTLQRWRSNSRNRLQQGKRPRLWDDLDLPDHIVDHVWAKLEKATTREDVDAAFAKAGDARPKVPAHEHERMCGVLADHYKPLITAAMRRLLPGVEAKVAAIVQRHEQLVTKATNADDLAAEAAAGDATGGTVDEGTASITAAEPALAAGYNPSPAGTTLGSVITVELQHSLTPDAAELTELLRELYGDAYLAGAHVASEQHGGGAVIVSNLGSVSAGIDWDNWEPGWGEAADKAADGGLRQMLDSADLIIQGVTDTQIDRIGNTLADGIDKGDSVQTIGKAVTAIVDDPRKAFVIANTETARAMTAAEFDTMRAYGTELWDLDTATDPCPVCEAIKDANPHPVSDVEDAPPLHPSCRCNAAPHIEIPEVAE